MKIARFTVSAVVAVGVIVGAATGGVAPSVAQPPPTIVLVHGAFADDSSWSKVDILWPHNHYTVKVASLLNYSFL